MVENWTWLIEKVYLKKKNVLLESLVINNDPFLLR